jgi:dipeptidyl aminopeptidase/acylaminoacyl peptidase
MTAASPSRRILLPALILMMGSLMIQAQAPAPKPIALDDYASVKRITGAALSNDGKWMHYTVTPNDGDGVLFVKALDGDTVHEIPRGANAGFSEDGRWIGYFIAPPQAEGRGRGRGARGGGGQTAGAEAPPARPFEVIDLTTGEKSTYQSVANFAFSPNGDWLLMRPQAPAPPGGAAPAGRGGRGGGAGGGASDSNAPADDLLMRRMATGEQRYLAKVAAYAFNEAGTHMAYTVRGQQRLGNGVYLLDLASGDQRTLDASAADYDQLAWSEEGANLAVLRGDKARDKQQRDNVVLTWRDAFAAQPQGAVFDPAKAAAFPEGMVVSEFTAPRWSLDGQRLMVGLKEQAATEPESSEPQANVDVWHWKDDDPQSVQAVQLNNARRATRAAIVDLGAGSIRQVADEKITAVTPTRDLKWAIGRDETPYAGEVAWGGSRSDIYRVNLTTGERTLIEPGLSRFMGVSPDGKWALYLKNGRVHSYEFASGRKTVIDGGRNFVDVEDDHDYERPVYGTGGFTADDRVLLYDKHDVWALPLAGGTPVNLTKGDGAKRSVRYRVTQLGRGGGGRGGGGRGGGPQEPIDLAKPVLLSTFGEWTKQSGYSELAPGGSPAPLIWADKAISTPIAAKNADRIIFTQQTFNEFPNYWAADKRFAGAKQVTDAYPSVFRDFAWGSRKLIDFKNSKGQRLQATLTLPAGYEPGKKYPMLVYFYERMSDTHHNFSFPVYDDRPHMSTYASNGYLVLQPDVVYEIGKPGSSALDCVTSAVKEVIRQGYADPARIGLQGHSWGGYQSSFIVTQTNMFAAVVTGAPPTNLVSFYNTLYRSSGNIQQGITEVGQVRMGRDVTPWSAHELYESQSPIHNAPKITTPFMILHGTADGAVDYGQGLEFYAAARRLGKPVILLSYPDEAHHLGRRENQKDFQIRMKQFFDHHLKGAPAPLWMVEGVPQLKKGLDPTIMVSPATRKTGR